MATFDDLELEKLAEADKQIQRKANTLGADSSVYEEPFGLRQIVLREDIFSETPTAETNFPGPDYGDFPGAGAVATRFVEARLHPLATSATNGNSSIQTFVAVRRTPASDSPEDIEAVRIKHLVPPDLSPARRTAGEVDKNFRGFELALYPAQDSGGTLIADTSNGPIPTAADPGDAYGIGDGRWTVDYPNGIVRFSKAPLNGGAGLVNPNTVYGNLDGYLTSASAGGRLTMFATFYEYVGPTLTDPDDVSLVTVGDGVVSFGTYYGQTSVIMQKAVDSLAPNGGTVFLKEGNYQDYTNSVSVPENTRIMGLSKNAIVTKPADGPAFIIFGNHSSIEGVTIKPRSLSDTGAMIEIVTTSETSLSALNYRTVENITIKDNCLYATTDSYGVGFAPRHLNAQYKNIRIEDNMFRPASGASEPIYIAELLNAGSVALHGVSIHRNDFGEAKARALYINGTSVEDILDLRITDNFAKGKVDLHINTGVIIADVYIANNTEFENVHVNELSGATIENNIFSNVTLDGYVSDSQFRDNILYNFELLQSANSFLFSGNTCLGDVLLHGDQIDTEGLLNVIVSNNKIRQFLRVSNQLSSTGNYVIDNLIIEDNRIDLEISLANFTDLGAGTTATYKNLEIRGNTIGDNERRNVINFGLSGATQTVYLQQVVIEGNTLYGDVNLYNNVQVRTTDGGLRFLDNTFDIDYRGFYVHGSVLNHLEIAGNQLAHIVLFEASTVLISNLTNNNIIIKDNSITDNGSIIFKDGISATGGITLTTNNVHIDGNIFKGTGNISLLQTSDSNQDYDMNYISVTNNKLPDGNIRLGFTDLSDSVLNNMTISGNYVSGDLFISGPGVVNQMNISDNIIQGNTGISEIQNDLSISNNSFYHLEIGGYISGATISNNTFENGGGLGFTSTVDSLSFVGNQIDGYLTIDAPMHGSTMTANHVYGTVDVNHVVSETSIIANIFQDDIDFYSPVDKLVFANNDAYGTASVSTHFQSWISDTIIADNRFAQGFVVSGGATNSNLSGNKIAGATTFSSNVHSLIINGNNSVGPLVMSERLTEVSILDNQFTSITLSGSDGTKDELMLSNNSFSDNAVISGGNVTHSAIVGNRFALTFDMQTACTSVTFGDNAFSGSISFGALTECTLTGNTSDGVSAVDGGVNFTGVVTRSNITGNVFDGQDNSPGPSVDFQDTVTETVFNGNHIFDGLLFGALVTKSNILNNTISDSVAGFGLKFDTAGSVDNSRIEGNKVEGETDLFGPITESRVSNNIFLSDLVIGEIATTNEFAHSILSGNIMSESALTVYDAISASEVMDNQVDGAADFYGAISNTNLGDNRFVSTLWFQSELNNVVFDGNQIRGLATFHDKLTELTLAGNMFNSDVDVEAAILKAVWSGNSFDGYTTSLDLQSTVDQLVLSNNRFTSELSVTGAVTEATVASNEFGGDIDFIGVVNRATFVSNVMDGPTTALNFQSSVTDATLTGNEILSAVAFDSTTDTVAFGNNQVNGTVTFTGVATDVSTVGNVLQAALEFSDAADNLTLVGNSSVSALTLSGALTDGTIANNRFNGAVSLSTISTSALTGNTFGSTTSVAALTESTISSSVFSGDIDVTGAVNRSAITGNVMDGAVVSIDFQAAVIDLTFTGNEILSAVEFDLTTDTMVLSNNQFNGSVTLTGIVDDVVVDGNSLQAALLFSDVANRVVISDNTSSSTLTVSGTATGCTVTGNRLTGFTLSTMIDSAVGNNAITGGATFGALTDTTVGNNIVSGTMAVTSLTNSTVSDNTITTNLTVSGNTNNTAVSNNTVGGLLDLAACSRDTISGNRIGTTSVFGTLVECTINDNAFMGDVDLEGTVDRSTISSNVMDGSVVSADFQGIVTDTVFSGNRVLTDVTFDLATNTLVFSDNQINGAVDFTGTATRVSINGNNLQSTLDFAIMNDVTVGNNTCTSTLTATGVATDCTISDNNFEGAVSFASLQDTNFTGNTFGSTFTTTGTSSRSTFGDNSVNGTSSWATIGDGTISGNVFAGDVDVTSSINRTAVLGNMFKGAGVSVNFQAAATDLTFVGNEVSTDVAFDLTTNTVVFGDNQINGTVDFTGNATNVTANGNVLQGALTFGGTTDNLALDGNSSVSTLTVSGATTDSTLTGNRFDGAVSLVSLLDTTITSNTFGSTLGVSTTITSSSMANNRIEGTTTISGLVQELTLADNVFAGDIDFVSAVDRSTITGNVMDGATISADFQSSVTDLTFVGNKLATELQFDSDIDDSVVGSNQVASDITILGTVTNSSVVDNICALLQLGVDGTASEILSSSVSDNNVTTNMLVYSGFRGAKANDNNVTGPTIFYGEVTGAEISDNKFDYELGTGLSFHSKVDNSVLSANSVSGLTQFASALAESTLTGGIFNGDVDFEGALLQTTISANAFDGYAIAADFQGTVNDSTIVGNRVRGGSAGGEYSVQFANSVSNTIFGNNELEDSLFISGTMDTLTITGNVIKDTMDLTGSINQSTISGNTFGDTVALSTGSAKTYLTISDNVFTSFSVTTGTLQNSTLDSNVITGTLTLTSGLSRSTVTGNHVNITAVSGIGALAETTFANNVFVGDVDFASTIDDSTISGNSFGGGTIAVDFQGTLTDTSVAGNTCGSIGVFNSAAITDSMIVSNRAANMTLGGVTRSNIESNHVDALTLSSSVSNSGIVGNTGETASALLTITGVATDVRIANNEFTGLSLSNASAKTNVTIVGNNFTDASASFVISNGGIVDSTISDNIISCGTFTFSAACTRTSFTGNSVLGTTSSAFGTMTDATITNNIFGGPEDGSGQVTFGVVSDSVISGNVFNDTGVSAYMSLDVAQSTFSGNQMVGSLSWDGSCNGVDIVGNRIEGTVALSGVNSITKSTFVGNTHGAFTSTSNTITNSVFTDNVCITSANTLQDMNFVATLTDVEIANNKCASLILNKITVDKTRVSVVGNSVDNLTITGGQLLDSLVSDNVVSTALNLSAGLTSSKVDSNVIESIGTSGSNAIGTMSNSTFSNNSISSRLTFDDTVGDQSVISGNTINQSGQAMFFDGAVSDTVISGNSMVGDLFVDAVALTRVTIVGNTISEDIDLSTGTVGDTIISDNYASILTVLDPTSVTISGNDFSSTVSISGTAIDLLFNSNNVGGSLTIGATPTGVTIVGNSLASGALINSVGAKSDMIISSNEMGDAFVLNGGTVTNLTLADNTMADSLTLGTINLSTIIGNSVTSTASIGVLTETALGNNSFAGNVSFTGTLTRVSIAGNIFDGASATDFQIVIATNMVGNYFTNGIAFDVSFNTTEFVANQVGSSAVITGAPTNVNFSNNVFLGTIAFSGALTDISIDDNHFNNSVTLPAANSTDVVFSNNTLDSTFEISVGDNVYTNLRMTGNSFGSTLSSGVKLANATIVGNVAAGDASFTVGANATNIVALEGCSITGNSFEDITISTATDTGHAMVDTILDSNRILGDLTIDNIHVNDSDVCQDCIISNNVVADAGSSTGNIILGSSLNSNNTALILENTMFMGNTVDGYLQCGNVLRDDSTITYNDAVFSGNIIEGASNVYGKMFASRFVDNKVLGTGTTFDDMVNVECNGNIFWGLSFEVNNVSQGSFSHNHMNGAGSGAGTTFAGAVNELAMVGNFFNDALTFSSTIVGSSLVGNRIVAALTFTGAVSSSVIEGNTVQTGKVDFNTTTGTLDDSVFADNELGGPIDFDTITDTTVTGNVFVGLVTVEDAVANSTIANNHFEASTTSLAFSSTITNSVIDANAVSNNVTFAAAIATSILSNNKITGTFDSDNSAGNYCVTDSSLTGNRFTGAFSISYNGTGDPASAIFDSTIANNTFGGTFTVETTTSNGDKACEAVTISGNQFDGAVTITSADTNTPTMDSCSITGNVFDSTIDITNSGASGTGYAFTSLSFNGNTCGSTMTIDATQAVTVGVNGSFSGNVINDSLVFGNSTTPAAHTFSRIIIQGNSGVGDVVFYTTGTTNTPECLIVGNGMSGTLDISGAGASAYTAPPGASQAMIALNNFGTYGAGLVFTDADSLGWGTNTAAAGADNDIFGTNL